MHSNIVTDVMQTDSIQLATWTVLNDCATRFAVTCPSSSGSQTCMIHVWFIQESFTLILLVRPNGGHSHPVIDVIDLSSDPRLILVTFDPLATRVNSQDKETPLGSWWSGEMNHSSGSRSAVDEPEPSLLHRPRPRSDWSPASPSVNPFLSLWITVCTGPYPISPLISLLGMEGCGGGGGGGLIPTKRVQGRLKKRAVVFLQGRSNEVWFYSGAEFCVPRCCSALTYCF